MTQTLETRVHTEVTSRRGLSYCFTPKHRNGQLTHACWLPEVEGLPEFAIFNDADELEIKDEGENLYGLSKLPDGDLQTIGTFGEKIAEFPHQAEGQPWHGYPVFPVDNGAKEGRRGLRCRQSKIVFSHMFSLGLLTKTQERRLRGGKT